jgi:DNA invertase Pin-like site-specific DNA recombinase
MDAVPRLFRPTERCQGNATPSECPNGRRPPRRVRRCWGLEICRFARSVKQLVLALEEFRSLGIDFISHQEALDTSTPIGRAMFTIIGSLAELERDVIRERTAAGLEYARQHGTKSGKPIGRPRAVFRHDQVLQLHSEGLSGRKIARRLGVGEGSVRRVLKAPVRPTEVCQDSLAEIFMTGSQPTHVQRQGITRRP